MFCERGCPEETFSCTSDPVFSSCPLVQSEVDVDFAVYYSFISQSQNIDFTNDFSQAYIPSGEPFFIELLRDFKSDGGQCDVVIRSKKILFGQAESARLWYEKLRNGLLERVFVTIKVASCLFVSKTVICVVYVDDCLF